MENISHNKAKPLVSVIIPCYNLGQFIGEAVDSVLSQTFQNFEIIIVDDGSTDLETIKILDNLKTPKTIIFKKENGGVAVARNYGISRANGKYILPLGADDMIEQTFLEKTVNFLEKNEDISFVTTWAQLFGEENYIWKTKKTNPQDVLLENTTSIASLFKKSCWEAVGGFDKDINKIGYYEDWDFWISLIEAGFEGAVIEEPLFLYRKRKNSMLTQATEKHEKLMRFIFEKHQKLFHEHASYLYLKKDLLVLKLWNIIQEKNKGTAESKELTIQRLEDELCDLHHSRIILPAIVLRKNLRRFVYGFGSLKTKVESRIVRFAKKNLSDKIRALIVLILPRKYRVVDRKVKNEKWDGPLISVITPFFNHGKTISETVESVLGQTFQNFEYIIVNDGSTDKESYNAFKNIMHSKIIKISQNNQGVSMARNNGITQARGKYILCLDSDDIIDPTYLEKMLTILESSPDVDIAYSHMHFFGIEDKIHEEPEFNPQLLYSSNIITTAAVFRKNAWEGVGGYKSGIGFEDWEFWINLVENGSKAKLLPESIFKYRRAAESRFIEDRKRSDENIKKIKKLHPNYLKKIRTMKESWISQRNIFEDDSRFINLKDANLYLQEKKDNKNILILMPWLAFGGAETLVYNFCSKIKNEFNISIMTGIKSENEWEYRFKEITDNIYHLPNLFPREDEYFEFVSSYIEGRKIDIIHIVHNGSFYGMLPELKRRFPSIKVISTVFNTVADHFDNSIKYADCIDAYTTDNTKVLDAYKKRSEIANVKKMVIHNGIDCDEKFNPFLYNRLVEREKMGIRSTDFAIYFMGRLSSEKNPDIFIEAAKKVFKKHFNIKFFVVGDGIMKDEIEKSIIKFGNDNLIYLGYQSDIPRFLSTADIFVLSSKAEGFPLSNVEAMAMGVCVIASDVGGVGDAVKDGETGFLMQPNSVEELVEKIEFAISQKEILEKISKNARKSVEENFSIEILGQKYKNLYENINEY